MTGDATLLWSGDLVPGPTGDIALITGSPLGQQRVIRRLMTYQNGYLWQAGYGAGLGQFVGGIIDDRALVGTIKSQIFQESAVARQPDPSISGEAFSNGSVYVAIAYVDALNGGTQTLNFTIST